MLAHLAPAAVRPGSILLLAVVVAGCAGELPGTAAVPQAQGLSSAIAVPAGARAFDVDASRTKVTALVYRAGPLARLGHNHAIVSGQESGVIWLGATPAASGFEVHVPVASFVVDDPEARAAAGPEFPGVVPDDARSGTTANMLRAEVLDAEHYPEIVVRAEGAAGNWQQAVVHAQVRLKDMRREMDVPVTLQVEGNTVTATGVLQIRQTDFGITPFSVAGGAVQVADVVDVRFEITGVRR
jgi:polyisoprenoid-binding protein YceI